MYLCWITFNRKHKIFTKISLGSKNFIFLDKSFNCVDQYKSLKISVSDIAKRSGNINTINWGKQIIQRKNSPR